MHISEEKCECHQQDLRDWLGIPGIASHNIWLTFSVEEEQESKKGQGRGGGLVKPNPGKKVNFLVCVYCIKSIFYSACYMWDF